MSLKTTGAEYEAFLHDDDFWSQQGDAWLEDTEFEVDGSLTTELNEKGLKPEAQIKLLSGYVFSNKSDEPVYLATFFRRWRKARNTTYLSVAVAKDKEQLVRDAILSAGGKIN